MNGKDNKKRFIIPLLFLLTLLCLITVVITGCSKVNEVPDETQTHTSSDKSTSNEVKQEVPDEPEGHVWSEMTAFDDYIIIHGSKKLTTVTIVPENFSVYLDGRRVKVIDAELFYNNNIKLQLGEKIAYAQIVMLSYSGGTIIDEENLEALPFLDQEVTNITWTGMWPVRTWDLAAVGITSAGGFCLGEDGSFYITDPKAGAIYHLDKDGFLIKKWGSIGAAEDAFGPSGPGDIEIYEKFILVTDRDKDRVISMDQDGRYMQTIGIPTTKDELPYFKPIKLGDAWPELVGSGCLFQPLQISMDMQVLDSRGVGQRLDFEDGKFSFDPVYTNPYDKSVIADPTTATLEYGIDETLVIDPDGNGLMDVVVRAFKFDSFFKYPFNGPTWGSYIYPVDAKRTDQRYLVVLDSGNNRLSIQQPYSGMWFDSVGGFGIGQEQFINPVKLGVLGNQVYVLDIGDMRIKSFLISGPPSLTMTATKASLIKDTMAAPYISFSDYTGGVKFKEKGIVYATHPFPTLNDSVQVLDSDFSEGLVEIHELTPGTHYYVRAYCTMEEGTSYSYQTEFVTRGGEAVPLSLFIEEASNAFDAGGNAAMKIKIEGDSSKLTECGFEISNNIAFRNASLIPCNVDGQGFSGNISKGANDRPVFVRAYAKAGDAVFYSRFHCFLTSADPQIVVSQMFPQEKGHVDIYGHIGNTFGHEVLEYGIVYGYNENPTIDDNKVIATQQEDQYEFCNDLSGIVAYKKIYYRGYIKTDQGIYYGNGGFATPSFGRN